MDSRWTPGGLHIDSTLDYRLVESMDFRWSMWTPCGLHVDSIHKFGWASCKENPCGLHMDSTTPHGVHMESMEECKVLVFCIDFEL